MCRETAELSERPQRHSSAPDTQMRSPELILVAHLRREPWTVTANSPLVIPTAGSSPAGRSFAARHADCLFMNIFDLDALPKDIEVLRASVPGRSPGVYASGHIISRATEKETREFYDYIVHEQGDWDAAEHIVNIRISGGGRSIPPEVVRQMTERHVSGIGTMPVVGTHDQVAAL